MTRARASRVWWGSRAGWFSEVLACGAESSAHAEDVCECTKADAVWSELNHAFYSPCASSKEGGSRHCMNTKSLHTQNFKNIYGQVCLMRSQLTPSSLVRHGLAPYNCTYICFSRTLPLMGLTQVSKIGTTPECATQNMRLFSHEPNGALRHSKRKAWLATPKEKKVHAQLQSALCHSNHTHPKYMLTK